MTVPQLISVIGWGLLSIAGAFAALHTVNLIVPKIDFLISTSGLGATGYAIAVPLMVLGLVLGMENAAQDDFGSIMETKKLR